MIFQLQCTVRSLAKALKLALVLTSLSRFCSWKTLEARISEPRLPVLRDSRRMRMRSSASIDRFASKAARRGKNTHQSRQRRIKNTKSLALEIGSVQFATVKARTSTKVCVQSATRLSSCLSSSAFATRAGDAKGCAEQKQTIDMS